MPTQDTRAVGARAKILAYLNRNGLSTLDDITAGIGEARTRVQSNLTATKADGLIESKRDDITNRPGYQITEAGKEWLKANNRTAKKPAKSAEPIEQSAAATGGDSEGGEADAQAITAEQREEFTLLGVIADIRKAIGDPEGRIMLGELAQHIKSDYLFAAKDSTEHKALREALVTLTDEIISGGGWYEFPQAITTIGMLIDAQQAALANGEKERADLAARLDDVTQQHLKDVSLLTEKNEKLHSEIEHLRADLANKEREVDQPKAEPRPLTVQLPHGFILRAPKQPELSGPTYTQHEHAVNAAAAAVRKGARRVRLFALLPAGQVVQGAEFIDA